MSRSPMTDIIFVSGLSGSGKSAVLDILEDAGYLAINNLPSSLLFTLLEMIVNQKDLKVGKNRKMAFASII